MKFSYKVWESTVIVRGRPKKLTSLGDKEFAEDEECAYLSVTDTWVDPPTGVPFVWMPWNESRKPTPELFYAVNRALLWWTYYKKLPLIEVFCDAGTHRSVTVFGAFLMTYFNKSERGSIVEGRKCLDGEDAPNWANPLDYIEGYLEEFPSDRLLFKAMGDNYLCRLDAHTRMIYEQVKDRYGDQH